MKDIIILGCGGHGLSVADTIERTGEYNIVGYTDVEDAKCRYEYLGKDEVLADCYDRGIRYLAMGIGFMGGSDELRWKLFNVASEIGFTFPTVVDPSAIISEHAKLGDGCFIGKGAIVNTEAEIGQLCIINSGVILDHECAVGKGTHIAVGSKLCGQVSVGNSTLIGAGTTVIQGKHIGDGVIVGAGSVVLRDITNGEKVYSLVK